VALHQGAVRDRESVVAYPLGRRATPHGGHALVRRRQIVLVLAGLTGIALAAAISSGSTAAWWALLATVGVGSGYLALLHHIRRVMAEREFAALLGPVEVDLSSWRDERLQPVASAAEPAARWPHGSSGTRSQAFAFTRFALANLAGWALSPLVFALTLLLGRTPRDTTGQRWLANLSAAQVHLREQSMRTLAISAATTASVTAAGTVAALTGTASASPLPTSAAMSAGPALSGSASGSVYQVQAGDTLGAIALRFGTTTAALAEVNHLSNPNLIYPYERLILPGGSTMAGTAPTDTSYQVQAGDTLGAIAQRFGTTTAALAEVNHLSNPNLIYPGELLVLRGGTTTAPPADSTPTPSSPARDTEPAPAPAPVTTAAQEAVRVALEQVGKPYQWAGAGPDSFDCSGLVMYAWAHAGVSLPHYSVAQYDDTVRISRNQLEPGDLVFYDTGDGAQPGHVTMYIGYGQIVTADEPGTVIRVEVINWDGIPMGYGRVR